MVKLIERGSEIKKLKGDNIFSAKIKSLYKSYGFRIFLDYYTQDKKAYIVSSDSNFILYNGMGSNHDELREFFAFRGFNRLICDESFSIPDKNYTSGFVMKHNNITYKADKAGFLSDSCNLKEAYNLLADVFYKETALPSYESFASEVTHRLTNNTGLISCCITDKKLVSFAFAETADDCAIITCVSTNEKYRHNHFGSSVVCDLVSRIGVEKNIFLRREENENKEFYNSIGFFDVQKWKEYKA